MRYRNLIDAVDDEVENNDDMLNTVDFVTLPPDFVDILTDEEDSFISRDCDNVDIREVPEICGEVEIFSTFENPETVDDLMPMWRQIPQSVSSSVNIETPTIFQNINDTSCNVSPEKYDSYETFSELFDENLLMYIVKQTNLYASQKNDHSFHLTLSQLKSFIGILLLTGYNRLSQQHMYWESAMDSGVDMVKKCMNYKRFKLIKKFIHFNDNSKLDPADKLFKVSPIIDKLNNNFKKFGVFHNNLSVDEQMIPYTGHHSYKMFMKGKPIRFGFK